MSIFQSGTMELMETMCFALLYEIEIIRNEVGECDKEWDAASREVEREFLEAYSRRVDRENKSKAQLRQAIADAEAELAPICAAMGERPESDQNHVSLEEELRAILLQVEEMRKRKCERRNQFIKVLEQVQKLKSEIQWFTGNTSCNNTTVLEETDLSLTRLEELRRELHELQTEKSQRLKKVQRQANKSRAQIRQAIADAEAELATICATMRERPVHIRQSDQNHASLKEELRAILPQVEEMQKRKCERKNQFIEVLEQVQKLKSEIQWYTGNTSCNNTTVLEETDLSLSRLEELHLELHELQTEKSERLKLMDTPLEEQQAFQNVTANIAASEDEVTKPISVDFINNIEAEVMRLEELKAKELVLKKRSELEELSRKAHMLLESDGAVDAASELEQMELQIARVKEEAFGRKDILERVEKWMAACKEECWLEEYNRDDNRYNAGRGAHLMLKRAEKARALVNKLPAMVGALATKTADWEYERGTEFTYDGIRLLSMLDEYDLSRHEKELERKRQRKKIQEQEALYGSDDDDSYMDDDDSCGQTSRLSWDHKESFSDDEDDSHMDEDDSKHDPEIVAYVKYGME